MKLAQCKHVVYLCEDIFSFVDIYLQCGPSGRGQPFVDISFRGEPIPIPKES